MQYGHERFSQFIASNNCHFYLPSLSDRNTFQVRRRTSIRQVSSHGIAAFVRPYAKYLDEKASSYREVAFDLCRMKLGKEDGGIRTMPQAKLLKTLPVIEKQLDALLAFDV
ncbi:phosphatidylinositol-binding clathrin assembly protein LAP, partial [Clonorchis sinensis]